jgi:hypothetical protein
MWTLCAVALICLQLALVFFGVCVLDRSAEWRNDERAE